MKARLLKALNIPGLILIALGMMTFQSALFGSYPLSFFQPNGILFLVLWISMRRSFLEGGILCLLLGYLVELHSAAPNGLYLVHSMTIFLMMHLFDHQFHISNRRSLITLGAVSSIFSRILLLLILLFMDRADNQWLYTARLLAPSAIIHAVLISPVFYFLHRFDIWTLKNPNAEHQHERDFYLDEEFV